MALSCNFAGLLLGILFFQTVTCARQLEPKENWLKSGQEDLKKSLHMLPNYGVAKNVILFIGDGLGLSTVHAMRIHKGQKKGNTGEEERLNFEDFPSVALIKTYETDRQIPESGGTATALMGGVKTRWNVVGLDDTVTDNKCDTVTPEAEVSTIVNWAEKEGKSTGVVTTARITHATPAAAYSKVANRYWEDDSYLPVDAKGKCKDTAVQLIERGQNISEWEDDKKTRGKTASYVWNKEQFDKVNPANTDYLLGLFGYSHMSYELDRIKETPEKEPSIAEMTKKAVQILKKNDKGFFLMVEAARIDMAHHDGFAKVAIEDGLAFELAVGEALKLTDPKDTLIVVTGDHSHSFVSGGYPPRGNPIFGTTGARGGPQDFEPAADDMPFTTLLYTNGPGFKLVNNSRANITGVDTTSPTYKPQAAVPTKWETHSGDDVAVYALGPMSHLFHGVHDQTYVAHVMGYASCVGPNLDHCKTPTTLRTGFGVTCLTDAEDRPKPNPQACYSSDLRSNYTVLVLICLSLNAFRV